MAVSTSTRAVVVDTASSAVRAGCGRCRSTRSRSATISGRRACGGRIAKRRCHRQYRLLWDTGRIRQSVAGRRASTTDRFRGATSTIPTSTSGSKPPRGRWRPIPIPSWSVRSTKRSTVVAAAQQPDGYLNSYFAVERAIERWTDSDLHELYCAGHLFQAAVAHHRATGSRRLLDVATRFADHIDATFGPAGTGQADRDGRAPGGRDGAGRAGAGDGRAALPRAGAVLRRRPRAGTAGRCLRPLWAEVSPGPSTVPRDGRDRWPRGARRLPERRRGRPLRRDGRSRRSGRACTGCGRA